MSEPSLLPPGIRIGSGVDLAERGVVRIDVVLVGGDAADQIAIVIPPHQAHAVGLVFLDQEDRRVRTLGALLIRQAKLVAERPGTAWGLRLVEGEG